MSAVNLQMHTNTLKTLLQNAYIQLQPFKIMSSSFGLLLTALSVHLILSALQIIEHFSLIFLYRKMLGAVFKSTLINYVNKGV